MTGAVAGLLLALGALDRPASPARNVIAARVATLERDLCLSGCPVVPATASSDWLRSEEGQKANGCQMSCRMEQPAAALYRELVELALRGALPAEAPLVKLAGKEGPDLARRLQLAVKEAEGRRLGPLCGRVRESFGPRDENAFLECVGRAVRSDAHAPPPPPEPAKALRCSTILAERDLDWLKRCVALEARNDIDACTARAEELAASRRQTAPLARSACEAEAIDRLTGAFRNRP